MKISEDVEDDPIINFCKFNREGALKHLKEADAIIERTEHYLAQKIPCKIYEPPALKIFVPKGFTCICFEDYKTSNRTQLIERLNQKLESLKGKKLSFKDKLRKKGLKNRIKKKMKGEERNRKKSVMRELKRKHFKVSPITDELPPLKQDNNEESGKIIFNKFDFTDSETADLIRKRTLKDPKKALKNIEERKSKIQQWKKRGLENKIERWKVKNSWEVVIQKAEGVKVKDDIDLLKKSIKKKENRKKKSKKKWEERLQQVIQKKEEVQKKRNENINKRKREKKKKKLKTAINKGRVVP